MAAFRTGVRLSELRGDEMRAFQQLLVRLGFDPGAIDGAYGPKTQSAYERFLKANNAVQDPNIVDSIMGRLADHDAEVWTMVKQGAEINVAQSAQPPAAPAPTSAAPPAPNYNAPAAPQTPTYTPPSTVATNDMVRQLYPNLAYLLDHPEIGPILQEATAGQWDAARLQGRVYSTSWWQTTAANARLWDAKMAQDPATAGRELEQKTVQIAAMLSRYGIGGIGDVDMRWLSGKILREGWSDDEVLRFFGGLARDGSHPIGPGKLTEEMAKVRKIARGYLFNMNDKDVQEWATRVMEGTASADAVESHLREQAMSRFYWMKDQISGGLTPEQLFASSKQAVAQLLEIDPESINLNDVKWSALVSPITDPNTKQVRSMNFNEVQKWARSQTDWRYTANARQEADDKALSLLRVFGEIG